MIYNVLLSAVCTLTSIKNLFIKKNSELKRTSIHTKSMNNESGNKFNSSIKNIFVFQVPSSYKKKNMNLYYCQEVRFKFQLCLGAEKKQDKLPNYLRLGGLRPT